MVKKKKTEEEEEAELVQQEALRRVRGKKAAEAEKKERFDKASRVFASPEWILKYVVPKGDKAAKLWRHLSATWKDVSMGTLRQEWEKHSKGMKG